MRACLPLLLLLSSVAIACSGADEGRPQGLELGQQSAEFDQCAASEGYQFLSLTDFEPHELEDGSVSESIECGPEVSVPCSFYFNYDMASSPANSDVLTSVGQGDDCLELAVDKGEKVFTSPRVASSSFGATKIDGGRCGKESWGQHIITENVGMCFGADGRLGWGATLDLEFKEGALDASEWDGIALWVKKGGPEGHSSFIFQLADPYTAGGQDPETLEPVCDSSDPALGEAAVPDSEKCDSFGTAITLNDEWTFVPARFDQLRQKGFGVVSPKGTLQTNEITKITIFIDTGNADFWIDDLALFRSPERSGE